LNSHVWCTASQTSRRSRRWGGTPDACASPCRS